MPSAGLCAAVKAPVGKGLHESVGTTLHCVAAGGVVLRLKLRHCPCVSVKLSSTTPLQYQGSSKTRRLGRKNVPDWTALWYSETHPALVAAKKGASGDKHTHLVRARANHRSKRQWNTLSCHQNSSLGSRWHYGDVNGSAVQISSLSRSRTCTPTLPLSGCTTHETFCVA